eukprot:3572806-Rhodomonas_salina.1
MSKFDGRLKGQSCNKITTCYCFVPFKLHRAEIVDCGAAVPVLERRDSGGLVPRRRAGAGAGVARARAGGVTGVAHRGPGVHWDLNSNDLAFKEKLSGQLAKQARR